MEVLQYLQSTYYKNRNHHNKTSLYKFILTLISKLTTKMLLEVLQVKHLSYRNMLIQSLPIKKIC